MFIKGFTWKIFSDFFPRWTTVNEPQSNMSRLLGQIALTTDEIANSWTNTTKDILSNTSQNSDIYEYFTIDLNTKPNNVIGKIDIVSTGEIVTADDEININLVRSLSWDEFVESPITRIEKVDEDGKEILGGVGLLGLNYFTSYSGYPQYVDFLTVYDSNDNGSHITFDYNLETETVKIFETIEQTYTNPDGDEIITTDVWIQKYFDDNVIDFESLTYDEDAIYCEYSYTLRNTPTGDVKLIDAIQNPDGNEISYLDGEIISLGIGNVYSDVLPTLRTWYVVDGDILTIYNPVSQRYIVEYEYTSNKTGPLCRKRSNYSVNNDSEMVTIPSVFTIHKDYDIYAPWNITDEDFVSDIVDIDNKLTYVGSFTDKDEYILDGCNYPIGSKLVFEYKGEFNFNLNNRSGLYSINLRESLGNITDTYDVLGVDIDSLYCKLASGYSDYSVYISYDEGFPIITISTDSPLVKLTIPYSYKTMTTINLYHQPVYNTMMGSKFYQTKVNKYSPSSSIVNVRELINLSNNVEVNIYSISLYSGISCYDRIVDQNTGIIFANPYKNTIDFLNYDFKYIGSLPIYGTNKVESNNEIYYKTISPDNTKFLGPIVAIDKYIYFILQSDNTKELFRISLYDPTPKLVHTFSNTNGYITDMSYTGDRLLISTIYETELSYYGKYYEYILHRDSYIYDVINYKLYVREMYDNIVTN